MNRNRLILFLAVLLLALAIVPLLAAQDDMTDVYGRALPEDAAPYALQTWRNMCRSDAVETTFTAVVSVYQRICTMGDLFSDSLVVLNNDLQLIPGAAESWEPSEDGLTWTFHLRPDQVWSDGTPLTAYDYEASYRFMADPANAYDFVWMWQGVIAGWDEAVAGEISPEEIGYRAVDDLTIEVETQTPFPPLPNTLFFWAPIQKAALEAHGANYTIDPATAVSSGPFILTEFKPGESVIFEANPTYNGYRKPILREMIGFFGDYNTYFTAFQNGEVDRVSYERLGPAEFEIIDSDPVMKDNYLPNPGDFRTDYLLMDTFNPPFDNQSVRLAFAKALDRDAIVANVIGPRLAIPAYSFLSPGFPASDVTGELHPIQAYDCDAAKQLLADAGYPDGAGFPSLTLQLRAETETVAARFVAAAASISSCLNVQIEVNNMEFSAYMTALLARPTTLQFGAVSYGMDYLDPANMLGVWVSTGRHSWRNAEFDNLVQAANAVVGDPEGRTQMYRDAERILVEDVGGIFLDHRIQGELYQPFVLGAPRELNSQGLPGYQWGNEGNWGSIYIGSTVTDVKTYRNDMGLVGE
ncbi:MAG: peptide ABC transporter substrate-binding protein [Anaerolineae bacterium]|nr:peptide ABC transporter substrate-binding protein [Anaerolineae bacterium]